MEQEMAHLEQGVSTYSLQEGKEQHLLAGEGERGELG